MANETLVQKIIDGKVKFFYPTNKEMFEKTNYNERQEIIKEIKKQGIRYGILFDNGQVLAMDSSERLRRELSLRSSISGSKEVLLVIQ